MAIEGAAEMAVFFDPDVFGEMVGYVLAGAGAGRGFDVEAIFTAPHRTVAEGAFGGVSTIAPEMVTAAANLPAGAGQGDEVSRANGNLYRVADLQPDGAGLVRVILERA